MAKRFTPVFFITLAIAVLCVAIFTLVLFMAPGMSVFGLKYISVNTHVVNQKFKISDVLAEELAYAEGEAESFASLGFSYTLSDGKAHLLSIPADVTPVEAKELFLSLIAEGAGGASLSLSEEMRRERMLYQMACKAAIKGGREYGDAHITWLVEEVLSLPDVTVCPHGRPIAYTLTKKELDKQFDRIK